MLLDGTKGDVQHILLGDDLSASRVRLWHAGVELLRCCHFLGGDVGGVDFIVRFAAVFLFAAATVVVAGAAAVYVLLVAVAREGVDAAHGLCHFFSWPADRV